MSVCQRKENLRNYRSLLDRVDKLCGEIVGKFAEQISCRAGCSECCRHLSLFPVEAASLAEALSALPEEIKLLLAGRIDWPADRSCPLLLDDRCTVYSNRPVICRTHGLPLLTEVDGDRSVACCPENFRGAGSLPGGAAINLETLNTVLAAINALFLENNDDERFQGKDRFTIADIIAVSTTPELI